MRGLRSENCPGTARSILLLAVNIIHDGLIQTIDNEIRTRIPEYNGIAWDQYAYASVIVSAHLFTGHCGNAIVYLHNDWQVQNAMSAVRLRIGGDHLHAAIKLYSMEAPDTFAPLFMGGHQMHINWADKDDENNEEAEGSDDEDDEEDGDNKRRTNKKRKFSESDDSRIKNEESGDPDIK